MRPLAATLDTLLFVGLCALLAFGPLALGASTHWSVCTIQVGVASLLALWAVRELASPSSEFVRSPLILPCVLFAAVVVIQLALGRTAYWNASWSRAMLWASYAGILLLTPQVVRTRSRLANFAVFLSVYGFLVALFAVVQQLAWNGKIYWLVPNPEGGWVYGPYFNHAHYSGLMEMLLPMPIIFAMSDELQKPIRALALFAGILMSATIFLSQSLGGIISFGAELLLILAIVVLPDNRSKRNMLLLGLMVVLLATSLLALHPIGLVGRLTKLHQPLNKDMSAARIAIFLDSFKMMRQKPIMGWGLGTFPVVYPSFRSFYSDFWINEAHNDYIQALVETGILGFGSVILFLAVFYRSGLRQIKTWRQSSTASIKLGALVGCTGLLVHGFFDFNLQVPANAALFFALAAVAVAQYDFKPSPKLRTRLRAVRSHSLRAQLSSMRESNL